MRGLGELIAIIAWLAGIIIAKGFLSTFFAFFIPIYAWYLVAERIVERYL